MWWRINLVIGMVEWYYQLYQINVLTKFNRVTVCDLFFKSFFDVNPASLSFSLPYLSQIMTFSRYSPFVDYFMPTIFLIFARMMIPLSHHPKVINFAA